MTLRPLLAAALLTLGACAYRYTPPALPAVTAPAPGASSHAAQAGVAATAARASVLPPVTILVSIDGFRHDYLDRGVTPRLSALAAGGVSAAMRPSFPSKTFPNHWTLVTGLVPDRHGIVANRMEDEARPGETFTMASDDPFWWNAAEPLWVTAERAGMPTATMFWPGSNVAWGGTRDPARPHEVAGIRPRDWQQYNEAVSDRQRVDAVIDWLRRPAETRPRFVTLYFDEVDTAGHDYGPTDRRTLSAVAAADASIGRLVDGLAALGQSANIVIVSDHGMAPIAPERRIAIDSIVPATDARVVESGPYATFAPLPGRDAAVAQALLRPHPHMTCWRKEALPPRFRYGRNPRVPAFLCLAEDDASGGWILARSATDEATHRGAHGFDNDSPDMRALFIAYGPAFAAGKRLPTFDNTDVAPLLRDLLGLPRGSGLDGDDAPFRRVMRR
ncbi:ectonucleotide pyrophosphatase/phosphodiesterase [Sphingomonas yunnanensis]|uniref:alkaline phosphatase family protein n=1 Tax=Sphingomonas yunnanensis TaxID=310400 RepID=UPI001CA70B2B|nr:ectonucleotide pyrophosphatase/phosphodiesterase [Sphingomonas yunnanensis]MBY9061447.1 ectonucleotide pyrophosphatase/phosphodiesterase [Sphingomonas yunnanensis]